MNATAPTAAAALLAAISIPMVQEKVCKGSVRYVAKDPEAIVKNVYVEKDFADQMPAEVTITINPAAGTPEAQDAIPMTVGKECGGSIRYEVPKGAEALVTNVYLSRRYMSPMPKGITVAVR